VVRTDSVQIISVPSSVFFVFVDVWFLEDVDLCGNVCIGSREICGICAKVPEIGHFF